MELSEVSSILVKSMLQETNQVAKVNIQPAKVFIAVPYYKGTMRIELSKFLQLQMLQGNLNHFPFYEGRPWNSVRNIIIKDFLETRRDYSHLLQVDTDVIPPANIMELANFNCDVISPVCFSFQEGAPFALCLKEVPGGYQQLKEIPGNQLIEVDAIGTGSIMIHRRVLEAMDPPWFDFTYDRFGILRGGEDFYFCRKAKAAGFKIHVHTSYLASHFSEIDLLQINNLLGKIQQESLIAGGKEVASKLLGLIQGGNSLDELRLTLENSFKEGL